MKNLKIEYTDKEITPWGGMSILKKMLEQIQMEQTLQEAPLPPQGSNRGYPPSQLIQNF